MRMIDADKYVCAFVFDDEYEEQRTETMTIADFLDRFTEEGCPVQEVTEMKWIPVSEKLPEKRQDVIVTVNDGAIYTDTDEWIGTGFFAYGHNVVAWQSLPDTWREEEE